MSKIRCLVAAGALCAACGSNVVSLDQPGNDDPPGVEVLSKTRELVTALKVDAGRVFWSSSWEPKDGYFHSALRSCDVARCGETIVTYDSETVFPERGFHVRSGEVFWFRLSVSQGRMYEQLVACPSEGCSASGPRAVGMSGQKAGALSTFDDDYAYFRVDGESGIYRVGLDATESIPEHVTDLEGRLFGMTTHGGYLYWTQLETPNPGGVFRTRADGSQPVEVLTDRARGVDDSSPYVDSPSASLVADDHFVYWAENTFAGYIKRCPVTGCLGEPEVVAGPMPPPLSLALDGGALYWEKEANGLTLASCSTAACQASPDLLTGLSGRNVFAIDDGFLYAATTREPDFADTRAVWPDTTFSLVRVAK